MNKEYYIGTYWMAWGETIERYAQRTEYFFRMLSQCDSSLSLWYEKGWTLEEALAHPVKTDARSIERVFRQQAQEEGRMAGDGFSLRIWNGEPDEGGLSLSLRCGEHGTAVPSICVIKPPGQGSLTERILAPSSLARLLRAMALAWEPEWGLATSHEHRDLMTESADPGTFIGWLTYLSHRRGPLPTLPPPIHIEPVEGLGSLVLLTPERFTVSNPAHLALAREVTQRLSHAGLLSPLRPRGEESS